MTTAVQRECRQQWLKLRKLLVTLETAANLEPDQEAVSMRRGCHRVAERYR